MLLFIVHSVVMSGKALWHAARRGDEGEVSRLLQAGVAADGYKDGWGGTPLHWACNNGHVGVVRLLVAAGADVAAKTNAGNTPLHCAARNGRLPVVRWLVQEGGAATHIHTGGYEGQTPVQLAGRRGHRAVVAYLEEAAASHSAGGYRQHYT